MDFNHFPPWLVGLVLAGVVVLINLGWFLWLALACQMKGGSC
jgi:hypothetical protein